MAARVDRPHVRGERRGRAAALRDDGRGRLVPRAARRARTGLCARRRLRPRRVLGHRRRRARRDLRLHRGAARNHPRGHLAVRLREDRHRGGAPLLPHRRALRCERRAADRPRAGGRRRSRSGRRAPRRRDPQVGPGGDACREAPRARAPERRRRAGANRSAAPLRRRGPGGAPRVPRQAPRALAVLRRLLFLVGAVVLVDTMFYAALTPLLPHYSDDLGLSKTSAGILAGSYAFGALVAGIPAGMLATRLGVKPTMLIGLGGMTLTTALFGFAHSVWLLDTARFLQGAASSFSWTAGLAWLIADAPANARGKLIGSAMGVAIFGAMLGPVIGGIASVTSTQATFGGIACVGLGLAAWAAATSSQREPSGAPVSMLFSALTKRGMLTGVWLVALPSISFGALGVLAPLRLHDLGLSGVAISAVWLVAVAFEATSAPLVGSVSDRRGRLWPLRIGALAAAACFVLFPLLDRHWASFAVGIAVCSFALGAFWA